MSRTDISFAIVCMVNSTAVDAITGTGTGTRSDANNATRKGATCAPDDNSKLNDRETVYFLFHFILH